MSGISKALFQEGSRKITGAVGKKTDRDDSVQGEDESDFEQPNVKSTERNLVKGTNNTRQVNSIANN